jgi:predicted acylesterase/phospholipase RssA
MNAGFRWFEAPQLQFSGSMERLILYCLPCMYGRYSLMAGKTALVLSAGAMFGAYQAGAWREIAPYFQPDLVVGTSAGALNGWLIAGGCAPEELIRLWVDRSTAEFLKLRPPLQRWRGLCDGSSFSKRVQQLYAQCRPRVPFGVVVTDVARLQPRLFQSEEVTWQHLAAACAIPLVLPQQRIGGRLYVDGGLVGVLPLWAAHVMGASRAVAVNVLPFLPSPVLRASASVVSALSPRVPSAGALEAITIVPAGGLGTLSEACVWNRETILRWVERGAADARRAMAERASRDSAQRVLQ